MGPCLWLLCGRGRSRNHLESSLTHLESDRDGCVLCVCVCVWVFFFFLEKKKVLTLLHGMWDISSPTGD